MQGREKILRATLDDFEPVLKKIEVGDDFGMQKADGVCRDRVAETGIKFLGYRSPSDNPSPLENLDSKTRHAEVSSAGESVVAPSDDHDIIRSRRRRHRQPSRSNRSKSRCLP